MIPLLTWISKFLLFFLGFELLPLDLFWIFRLFRSCIHQYSLGIVGASSTNMEPEIKIEIMKSFEKSVRSVMIQTRDSVIQTQYLLHTEERHLEFNLF